MIVYLSGAMEFAENEGAEWRKNLTTWLESELGHTSIDPVVESAKLLLRIMLMITVIGKPTNQKNTLILLGCVF